MVGILGLLRILAMCSHLGLYRSSEILDFQDRGLWRLGLEDVARKKRIQIQPFVWAMLQATIE